MPAERRCELCEFWVAMTDGNFGNCHRYPPPQALVHPDLAQPDRQLKLAMSMTQKDAWCGEFKRSGA